MLNEESKRLLAALTDLGEQEWDIDKLIQIVAANNERLSEPLRTALRRSGFEGEPNWKMLMAAWRSTGLPIEAFERSSLGDLIFILEARSEVLDGLNDIPETISPLVAKATGLIGGRPTGVPVDLDELGALQGNKTNSIFARLLGIHINSLARIQREGRASSANAKKIRKYKQKSRTRNPIN